MQGKKPAVKYSYFIITVMVEVFLKITTWGRGLSTGEKNFSNEVNLMQKDWKE